VGMVEERSWSACTCDVHNVYGDSDIGIFDKADMKIPWQECI